MERIVYHESDILTHCEKTDAFFLVLFLFFEKCPLRRTSFF